MGEAKQFQDINPDEPAPAPDAGTPELSPEEKFTKIKGLLTEGFNGEVPDAVFSFGASIKYHSASGNYRTLAYSDLSEHGLVTGSRTRVIATAEIAKVLPDLPIVTTSINRLNPDEPSMAAVVMGELVRKGVKPDRIELEEESFNTITQLTAMVKKAVANNWLKVVAVTNSFHLPRITEMRDRLDMLVDDSDFQARLKEFKDRGGEIQFICAEDIMRTMGDSYSRYLDLVERSPEYAATVAAEAQGLKDLQTGNYNVTLKPEKSHHKD